MAELIELKSLLLHPTKHPFSGIITPSPKTAGMTSWNPLVTDWGALGDDEICAWCSLYLAALPTGSASSLGVVGGSGPRGVWPAGVGRPYHRRTRGPLDPLWV